jgi:hypothetical protein
MKWPQLAAAGRRLADEADAEAKDDMKIANGCGWQWHPHTIKIKLIKRQ